MREFLADGPRRRTEIVSALGMDSTGWNGASLWVDLVRVPPSGTWEQRRADRYGLAESWVGPSTADVGDGIRLLVRRYLGAFGPAARGDIASWAGLPVSEVDVAIARMRVRRFEDESGGALVDLPGAALPGVDTPVPVRFLPTWDATLLVHARRTQILPEPLRPAVFNTKTPHSVPTFLVDGQVAGTWRFEDGIDLDDSPPDPDTARTAGARRRGRPPGGLHGVSEPPEPSRFSDAVRAPKRQPRYPSTFPIHPPPSSMPAHHIRRRRHRLARASAIVAMAVLMAVPTLGAGAAPARDGFTGSSGEAARSPGRRATSASAPDATRASSVIRGIDVSHWQGPIDWSRVAEAGQGVRLPQVDRRHRFRRRDVRVQPVPGQGERDRGRRLPLRPSRPIQRRRRP